MPLSNQNNNKKNKETDWTKIASAHENTNETHFIHQSSSSSTSVSINSNMDEESRKILIDHFQIPEVLWQSTFLKNYKIDYKELARRWKIPFFYYKICELWQLIALIGRKDILENYLSNELTGINQVDYRGRTFLHLIALSGNFETLKWFLTTYSVNLHTRDDKGSTVIHYAALNGNRSIIEGLITEFNINPNTLTDLHSSALHFAAYYANKETIEKLILHYYSDPQAQNSFGYTPLHYAALGGNIEVVHYLIDEFYLNPADQNSHGENTLQCFLSSSNGETIHEFVTTYPWLISTLSREEKNKLLHAAAKRASPTHIQFLKNQYALNISAPDKLSNTLLHTAAKAGHLPTLTYIADLMPQLIHTANHKDELPLHFAIESGSLLAAQYFIKKMSSAHLKQLFTQTYYQKLNPIHYACKSGNLNMVKFIEKSYNYTPDADALYLAALYGHTALVKYFVEICGISVNQNNKQGLSILSAVFSNHGASCIQYCLSQLSLSKQRAIIQNSLLSIYQKKDKNAFFQLLKKIGSFYLYHLFCEVNEITHILKNYLNKEQEFFKTSSHIDWINNYTALFQLHYLLIYKNEDEYHQITLSILTRLIKNFQTQIPTHSYQAIINDILEEEQFPTWKVIGISTLDIHPFKKHLDLLKKIPEEMLENIVPEYLEYLQTRIQQSNNSQEKKLLCALNNENVLTLPIIYKKDLIKKLSIITVPLSTAPMLSSVKASTVNEIKPWNNLCKKFKIPEKLFEDPVFINYSFDYAKLENDWKNFFFLNQEISEVWQLIALIGDHLLLQKFIEAYPQTLYQVDSYGRCFLHFYALSGDVDNLIIFKETYNLSLLANYIKNNSMLEALAKSGCSFDSLLKFIKHYHIDLKEIDKINLLFATNMGGNPDTIQSLIEHFNLDPNVKSSLNQRNLLSFAAVSGNPQAVEMLMNRYKLNPLQNYSQEEGTSLQVAAKYGNQQIVTMLLNKLVKKYSHERIFLQGIPLLLIVAKSGNVFLLETLTRQYGCDPYVKSKHGNDLLTWAAWGGHVDAIEWVIQYCPDAPFEANPLNLGRTPLHYAAMSGNPEAVQCILHHFSKKYPTLCSLTYISSSENVSTDYFFIEKGAPSAIRYLIETQKIALDCKKFNNLIANYANLESLYYLFEEKKHHLNRGFWEDCSFLIKCCFENPIILARRYFLKIFFLHQSEFFDNDIPRDALLTKLVDFKDSELEHKFLESLGSFNLFYIFYKINITHNLANFLHYHERFAALEKFINHFTLLFQLHYLFTSKNKDKYHNEYFLVFCNLIQAFYQKKENQSYQHLLNTIFVAQAKPTAWRISILEVGIHPLQAKLNELKSLPEEILQKIVPDYLHYLLDIFYKKDFYKSLIKDNELAIINALHQKLYLIEMNNELVNSGLPNPIGSQEFELSKKLASLCKQYNFPVDWNYSDPEGRCLLHLIAYQSTFEIFEFVLNKSFLSLYRKDYQGRMITHYAALNPDPTLLFKLLDTYKLNPNVVTYEGCNVIHYAVMQYDNKIIKKLILDYQCDPNSIDRNGHTALHFACKKNNITVIKSLINEFLLCPAEQDKNSFYPFDYLEKKYLDEVKEFSNEYITLHPFPDNVSAQFIGDYQSPSFNQSPSPLKLSTNTLPDLLTLLFRAAYWGELRQIRYFAEHQRISLKQEDDDKKSVLLMVLRSENTACIRYCIHHLIAEENCRDYVLSILLFHLKDLVPHAQITLLEKIGSFCLHQAFYDISTLSHTSSFLPNTIDFMAKAPAALSDIAHQYIQQNTLFFQLHFLLMIKNKDEYQVNALETLKNILQAFIIQNKSSSFKTILSTKIDTTRFREWSIAGINIGKQHIFYELLNKLKELPDAILETLMFEYLEYLQTKYTEPSLYSKKIETQFITDLMSQIKIDKPLYYSKYHFDLDSNDKTNIMINSAQTESSSPPSSISLVIQKSELPSWKNLSLRFQISPDIFEDKFWKLFNLDFKPLEAQWKYFYFYPNWVSHLWQVAALLGDQDILAALIKQEPDTMYKIDSFDRYLLHWVGLSGNIKTFTLLINDYHLNPYVKDEEGHTPLSYLAMSGCSFQDLESIHRNFYFKETNCLFAPGFLQAIALGGNIDTLESWIAAYKISPYQLDSQNRSLLECASIGGHTLLVKHLIKTYKLNPFANNRNALQLSLEYGNKETFIYLCNKLFWCSLSDINKKYGPLLHIASASGNIELMQHLKNNYLDLSERGSHQETLLFSAAKGGHATAIAWALERSPATVINEPNPTYFNRLPAHIAAWYSPNPLAMKYFLEKNPHLMVIQDTQGLTITHYASANKNPSILLYLAYHGYLSLDARLFLVCAHLSHLATLNYFIDKFLKLVCKTIQEHSDMLLDNIFDNNNSKAVRLLTTLYILRGGDLDKLRSKFFAFMESNIQLEEKKQFTLKLGSFCLFHIMFKIDFKNDLTHANNRLNYPFFSLQANHKLVDMHTLFFQLHYLFVNKEKDKYHQNALQCFTDILKNLSISNSTHNYQTIIEDTIAKHTMLEWKIGFFSPGIHILWQKLYALRNVEKEDIKIMTTEYFEYLRGILYQAWPVKSMEKEFVEALQSEIQLLVNTAVTSLKIGNEQSKNYSVSLSRVNH